MRQDPCLFYNKFSCIGELAGGEFEHIHAGCKRVQRNAIARTYTRHVHHLNTLSI